MMRDIAICGFIGMILHMLSKAYEFQNKARRNNIQFHFAKFFVEDWLSHLISSFAVILYLFLINRRVEVVPDSMYEVLLAFSATVGYSGDSLVAKFFSATSKRIEAAIDYKTTIADQATNNQDAPTPATKP